MWSRGVRNKENVYSRSHHSTLSVSTENHHWCEVVNQSKTLVVLTIKAEEIEDLNSHGQNSIKTGGSPRQED